MKALEGIKTSAIVLLSTVAFLSVTAAAQQGGDLASKSGAPAVPAYDATKTDLQRAVAEAREQAAAAARSAAAAQEAAADAQKALAEAEKAAADAEKAAKDATAAKSAPEKKTLFIEKIEHHLAPRTRPWCMYVEAQVGDAEDDYRGRNIGPVPSQVRPNLRLEGVSVGDVCEVRVFLDDDFDRVGANASDRARGTFRVTSRGKKNFRYATKGQGNYFSEADENANNTTWHFTLFWHLE